MSPKISSKTTVLTEAPTRRMDLVREELTRRGKKLYMLSTGQPSVLPPLEVREYLADLLKSEEPRIYSYTPSSGYSELREAISEDLREFGKVDVDPNTQVLVTSGGQEGMFVALSTILEEGDEAVLLDPTFFGYKPIIEYLGGRVKFIPTSVSEGFQPDLQMLQESLSRRVKVVVLVSPDNPTGRILDLKVVKAISELAVDYDFWIVYDEAYRTIVYEGEHVYLYNYAPENAICINAFSKDPGVPGWRLGFIYGPREAIEKAKLLSEKIAYCPPSFAQVGVTYYLKSSLRKTFLKRVVEVCKRKRDVLAEALNSYLPRAKFSIPRGGMFIFADFKPYLSMLNLDSEAFSTRLLNEKLVATIPGGYFGVHSRDYVRLSFVAESEDRLKKAVELIREFIDESVESPL